MGYQEVKTIRTETFYYRFLNLLQPLRRCRSHSPAADFSRAAGADTPVSGFALRNQCLGSPLTEQVRGQVIRVGLRTATTSTSLHFLPGTPKTTSLLSEAPL